MSNLDEIHNQIPVYGNTQLKVKCRHCSGLYSRRKFSVHLKKCSANPDKKSKSSPLKSPKRRKTQALKDHSLPIAKKNASDALNKNILPFMKEDEITRTVLNDALILEMGSQILMGMGHKTERHIVSQKMRDLAQLLIKLREIEPRVKCLRDALNPAYYEKIIEAVRTLAKIDESSGEVGVVGMAYRMSQVLNKCLRVHLTKQVQELHKSGSVDRSNISKIEDFIKMIENNWADMIGKQSTKALKYKKSLKVPKMALADDIMTVSKYIDTRYDKVITKLKANPSEESVFDLLVDMVVAHIMLLIRRRPIDIERAEISHYKLMNVHDECMEMLKKASDRPIDEKDLEACSKFHIFYPIGKKYDLVPIVLTDRMKDATEVLLEFRHKVGITNQVLFSHSRNRTLNPAKSLERMKGNIPAGKLKKPVDLCATGLRHQAATFSKLHSSNPNYQEHLAAVLGHTLYIHKKNYDLPTSVSHKAIVMPVLHSMTTGNWEVETSRPTKDEHHQETTNPLTPPTIENQDLALDEHNMLTPNTPPPLVEEKMNEEYEVTPAKKKHQKKKWSSAEKRIVWKEFGRDILKNKKINPQRVRELRDQNSEVISHSLPQLMTYLDNAKKKKFHASPVIKKYMNE